MVDRVYSVSLGELERSGCERVCNQEGSVEAIEIQRSSEVSRYRNTLHRRLGIEKLFDCLLIHNFSSCGVVFGVDE